MWALTVPLLMVVGAAAANEDLRLVDAMKNQDLQRVRTLLDQHADVNVRSEDGSTALLWAAAHSRVCSRWWVSPTSPTR